MKSEGPLPKPRLSIPEWDKGDRPRERMMAQGAKALSDAELVAILIRSGTRDLSALELAKQLLKETGNDINRLAALSPADLMKRKGVGEAKALSILAALELGMRRRSGVQHERPRIHTSAQAHEELRAKLADLPHEEFWLLLLDRGLRLIESRRVSVGGLHGTVADPKVIFRCALEKGASCMVVGHNHPSGQLRPSEEDVRLTHKLMEGGRMLDIIVQDHIIITAGGFYSFADNGQMH
ncbi:MAG: DNA repair protein RadC [Flavobacteriales bacterium]|nr:DNA repair protein RadC [Flavobacteriales bacterium]